MKDFKDVATVDMFKRPVGRPKKESPLTGAERKRRYDQKKRLQSPPAKRGRPKKPAKPGFYRSDAFQLLQSIEQRLDRFNIPYEIIIDIQNLYYFSDGYGGVK